MKKLFTLLLFSISATCFSQKLVDEVCIGTPNSETIIAIHENTDSTTSIISSTSIYISTQYYYTFELLKLDKDKHLFYRKKLDSAISNINLWEDNGQFDADGSMLLLNASGAQGYKLDKNGNFLWKADSIGLAIRYGFIRATQKTDGGYLFYTYAGFSEKEIVSVSNTGHFLWSKHMSFDSIIPPTNLREEFSVEPLFNKNTLVTFKASQPSFSHVGDDTDIIVLFLLDSSGVLIARDTQNLTTSPYQSITDFTSHHYIFRLTAIPEFTQIVLLDPADLSVVRYETLFSLDQLNMTTYNHGFDDTSHIFIYPYVLMDSTLHCLDIHSHLLWSYKFHHIDVHNSLESIPMILDNNRVFADRSLIDNGVKIWESNIDVKDSIFYKNKIWYNAGYLITRDYNGRDISYIINYNNSRGLFGFNGEQLSFVQIIDIQTGLVKERMIIDPVYSTNVIHYGPQKALIASYGQLPCNFGLNDIYLAYYSGTYNSIAGIAYIDYNNNHVMNSGEPTYPWGYAYTQSTTDSQMAHLYSNGQFLFYADTGHYSTHVALYNDYFTISPGQFISSHSSYGNTDTVLFALFPKPGKNDGSIQLVNNWLTRPGRDNSYTISLSDKGAFHCNGRVKLVIDPRLLNVSTTPNYSYKNGDTIVWNISNLFPATTLSAIIHFTAATPPLLNVGDTILSKAWFENDSIDVTPEDNYAEIKEGIRASYDPNGKSILSGGNLTPAQVANGDYISYIIHFQNMGNDTAFRVIVVDTLSPNVDVSSLQIINASAPYTLEIFQEHILKFTFNNIRLLFDTANLNSTGYIAYKLKPKTSLTSGNTINNTANIFFDYNQPVRTNTVQTQIALLSAIVDPIKRDGKMHIYPNPNSGNFSISYESEKSSHIQLQLIDVTGQIIYTEKKEHSLQTVFSIDQTTLPKGIYWIKLSDDKNIYTQGIIVQ